jgi:TolB-like protein
MDAVWPDVAVEENNLTQQISTLRKALGEHPDEHKFIVTVPGTGYAFIAPLISERDRVGNDRLRNRFFADHGGLGYVLAMVMVIFGLVSLAVDLHKQTSHAGLVTIAVLSFHSLDGRDDTIAAGMPYTLTAKLGDLRDVMSVRPAVDITSDDVLAAGRELRADAVLNGTIQHSGDKVRVSVQMTEVSGGRVIWGRNIDADDDRGFSVQDAVASEVVVGLKELYARD